MCCSLDKFQIECCLRTNTSNLCQSIDRRRQNSVKITECVKKVPRKRFDIASFVRPKQQKFQHFVIGYRVSPTRQKSVAQPLAMPFEI
jgi:hypothetical protein